ncbi:hypothetical protein P7C71_g4028, partial [Lecanoromycetidae sp. Uapishka_2]
MVFRSQSEKKAALAEARDRGNAKDLLIYMEKCSNLSPESPHLKTIANSKSLPKLLQLLPESAPSFLGPIFRRLADKCDEVLKRIAVVEATKKSDELQEEARSPKRVKRTHNSNRRLKSRRSALGHKGKHFLQRRHIGLGAGDSGYSGWHKKPSTPENPDVPQDQTPTSAGTENVETSEHGAMQETNQDHELTPENLAGLEVQTSTSAGPENVETPEHGSLQETDEDNESTPENLDVPQDQTSTSAGTEDVETSEHDPMQETHQDNESTQENLDVPQVQTSTSAGTENVETSEHGPMQETNEDNEDWLVSQDLLDLANNIEQNLLVLVNNRGETNDTTASQMSERAARYRKEHGITRNEEHVLASIRKQCRNVPDMYKGTREIKEAKREVDLEMVLQTCTKLKWENVCETLLTFLEDRLVTPGKAEQLPSTWNMDTPGEILDALQTIQSTTEDAMLHRAFGQMRLRESVKAEEELTKTSATTILGRLAIKKAGEVSAKAQARAARKNETEYFSGYQWLKFLEWFGGSGIVFVFITSGIGPSFVTDGWSDYQRECFHEISEFLPSIKSLVETLGKDSLDYYCRHGQLDRSYVTRVEEWGEERELETLDDD